MVDGQILTITKMHFIRPTILFGTQCQITKVGGHLASCTSVQVPSKVNKLMRSINISFRQRCLGTLERQIKMMVALNSSMTNLLTNLTCRQSSRGHGSKPQNTKTTMTMAPRATPKRKVIKGIDTTMGRRILGGEIANRGSLI